MSTESMEARLTSFEGVADSRLVALSIKGDAGAFETIMRRNNRLLFRIARGILGNDADAEDAVQECYVKAYQHLSGFEGRSKLSTWLSRMVANESLGQLRRRGKTVSESQEPSGGRLHQDNVVNLYGNANPGPDEQLSRRQLKALIEQAIDCLPEKFRTVFLLREVEGMSVNDIAAALDIPESTVKTRNFRARKLLRADIEERMEPALRDAFLFLGDRCDRMVHRVLEKLQEIGAMTR